MKTLLVILVAAFLITSDMLSQDGEMNNSTTTASAINKNAGTYSMQDAVIMQEMTSLDRTVNWNKLFKNPPENGFIVFDTDENAHYFFNGNAWEHVVDIKRDINGDIINEKLVSKND